MPTHGNSSSVSVIPRLDGQEKVDERHDAAAQEPKAALIEPALDELHPKFHRVRGRQSDQRLDPRLLEAQPRMPQNVQDRNRGGESAQTAKAVRAVPFFSGGVARSGRVRRCVTGGCHYLVGL
jgi:hypothetical protein